MLGGARFSVIFLVLLAIALARLQRDPPVDEDKKDFAVESRKDSSTEAPAQPRQDSYEDPSAENLGSEELSEELNVLLGEPLKVFPQPLGPSKDISEGAFRKQLVKKYRQVMNATPAPPGSIGESPGSSGDTSQQPSAAPPSVQTGDTSQQPSAAPPSGDTQTGDTSQQPSAAPPSGQTGGTSQQPSAPPSGQTGGTNQQPSAPPSGQTGGTNQQPSAPPSGQTGGTNQQPSAPPSGQPTDTNQIQPTGQPTQPSTASPSGQPTGQPTQPTTAAPSGQTTAAPSGQTTATPSQGTTAMTVKTTVEDWPEEEEEESNVESYVDEICEWFFGGLCWF